MGFLSKLRRFLFPTMAERMEGLAMQVGGTQGALHRGMQAHGRTPCGWCAS